eukprot:7995686-Karenia_brevis.AAC.1
MTKTAVCNNIANLGVGFNSESRPIFVSHIHDEASLRLRSFDASLPGRPVRGRFSKVQNNCVAICFPDDKLEWPTELQALGRKTGVVLATCMVDIMSELLRCLSSVSNPAWTCLRVNHLLVGDGIGTNQNAAKRILRYFLTNKTWGDVLVRYRLVVVRCASHAANLVVLVAICGQLLKDAVECDEVSANCSRLYKHLIPDYIEEFSASLQIYLTRTFRVELQENVDEATQRGRESA